MSKVNKQIEIKIHQAPEFKRKDSFWFDGHVATITDGKNTINIIATGHICVFFEPDGDSYKNDEARKFARSKGYTDIKLNILFKHDGWSNNNWFAFEVIKEGKTPVWDEATEISFDNAIETAKNIIKEL